MAAPQPQPDALADRVPLRTLFMLTSMPIGGAETLLVNLIRQFDRRMVLPEVCCLKGKGPLGEQLSGEIPVHANLICHKTDFMVTRRLVELMRRRRIDAVVTVGAGDKMFWGRIAACWAGVPVITSALHSTGWPDGIGYLNRLLTPVTDGFIAVAESHGRFLVEQERLPPGKVFVIPNGVDTQLFSPVGVDKPTLRAKLQLPATPKLVTLVAALRPEKNHARFLRVASGIRQRSTDVEFLIVGDGPERARIESLSRSLNLAQRVHFLGARSDIADLLAASDVFLLTSDNEASPVSILEAMSCGVPVVASKVGSVGALVVDGTTGFCVPVTDELQFVAKLALLLEDTQTRIRMGQQARQHVIRYGSLTTMVQAYEQLLQSLYVRKTCSRQQAFGGGDNTDAAAQRTVMSDATK